MNFNTLGDKSNPAILFFHAMGVTGDSSIPVANYLKDNYFCIMPTSSVYSKGHTYVSKDNELLQLENFLKDQSITELKLVVASSLGADLATSFISKTNIKIEHIFFDGGQFAQIKKSLRTIMVPFLYLAIKSLYWSKGKTLKHILWCDDENIKPYFIEAGKNLTYKNLKAQLNDSVVNEPFPSFPKDLQKATFWEFGSIEDHFKYRDAVMKAYPFGNFPIFKDYNHMQFQIKDPKGFANMLIQVMNSNSLPELPFLL